MGGDVGPVNCLEDFAIGFVGAAVVYEVVKSGG